MPFASESQRRLMQGAAHSPEFAKKTGVSQAVAQEYIAQERSKKLAKKLRKSDNIEASGDPDN